MQMVLVLRQPGEELERIVHHLRSRLSDGILLVSHRADDRVVQELEALATPAVLIGRPFDDAVTLPFVDTDNAAGARLAVEHLVSRGAQRIGLIAGPEDARSALDRETGYRAAMQAFGMEPLVISRGPFTEEHGHDAARTLLHDHRGLDGVFVASDTIAKGFVEQLSAAGVLIPEEMRVVGFDDSRAAVTVRPRLSTIANPAEELAQLATRRLLALINGNPFDEPTILEPALVIRSST